MISQSAVSVERHRWSKNTQLAPLWRELSSLNNFIWASSASVWASQGLLEVELPRVRDGIRSAAPQSGLPSHLTTQQFNAGKSFLYIYICNHVLTRVMFWCWWAAEVPSVVHWSLDLREQVAEQLLLLQLCKCFAWGNVGGNNAIPLAPYLQNLLSSFWRLPSLLIAPLGPDLRIRPFDWLNRRWKRNVTVESDITQALCISYNITIKL